LYSEASGAAGIETCRPCRPGTWSEIGSPSCQACPGNSNSSQGSAFQLDCRCNTGATGQDGQTCELCTPGKYKPSSGSAACSTCPENSESATGQSFLTSCVCKLGHAGPAGGPCIACVAGKYSMMVGAQTCSACSVGSYETTEGSTACTLCGVNYYGSIEGAVANTSCVECPLSSHSNAGSANISQCHCNTGYLQTQNHDVCIQCDPGKFYSELNRYECSKCAGGASIG
jgi:hypothetical protein